MRSCQANGTKLEFYATTRADGRPADRKSVGADSITLSPVTLTKESALEIRGDSPERRYNAELWAHDFLTRVGAIVSVRCERTACSRFTLGRLSAISRMRARKETMWSSSVSFIRTNASTVIIGIRRRCVVNETPSPFLSASMINDSVDSWVRMCRLLVTTLFLTSRPRPVHEHHCAGDQTKLRSRTYTPYNDDY